MWSVYERMARQHGVISLQQARAHGMNQRQVQRRVDRGDWLRVHRGVYRAAASPRTWPGDVLAAVFYSGGVASHRCAAALWGLSGWREPPIELLLPSGRNCSVVGRVHRTTQWDRIDRTVRRQIPVTGIERTILDLGAVVSLRTMELAAESAIRQQLVTWPRLRASLIRHARRGRDGCGRLRRLLEIRHGDDELPLSDWSRLVANTLVDRGIPAPELEFPIVDEAGSVIAVVDLAWPAQRVAIELDSVRWHLNRRSFELDKRKRNRLRRRGWFVHEVTWSMSMDEPDGLAGHVREALELGGPV